MRFDLESIRSDPTDSVGSMIQSAKLKGVFPINRVHKRGFDQVSRMLDVK